MNENSGNSGNSGNPDEELVIRLFDASGPFDEHGWYWTRGVTWYGPFETFEQVNEHAGRGPFKTAEEANECAAQIINSGKN